jgi:hypothetical protein
MKHTDNSKSNITMAKTSKTDSVSALPATSEKTRELLAKRAELEQLEQQIKEAQEKETQELLNKVNALPAQFGVETIDAFLDLVNRVTGRKSASKRARISKEIKEKITSALKAGTKTAKELAAEFNVSVPSVNALKKVAGLTKARKAKK